MTRNVHVHGHSDCIASHPPWLTQLRNHRPQRVSDPDSGNHVCLRAPSIEHVMAFYRVAIARGARGDGPPGMRPEYHEKYYAAFIRDFDENLVEVVTFVDPQLSPTR